MTLHVSEAEIEPPAAPLVRDKQWLPKVPRGQFWYFYAGTVFQAFGISIFFFLFNIYLLGFGWNERSLGLIGSMMALGSILGTIPAGMLAERLGLRWTLCGGLSLAIIFSILRACILWQPAQLAFALLTGFTLSFWAVSFSPAIASLTTEPQRPFAFSLFFASGISFGGLGGLVAGRLPGLFAKLPLHVELRSTHSAQALTLLFGCAVMALALLPLSHLSLRATVPKARLPRFNNPFLRRFLPAMAVWNLVTGSFLPFATVYFVHHLGVSLESMGNIYSVSQLIMVFAVLSVPLIFRRTGLVPGLMLTQLATAAAMVFLAGAHNVRSATLLYWAMMAAVTMSEPGIYSMLMDRTPEAERSGASAATFFVNSASQIIASYAIGSAIVQFGYPRSLLVIAAFAVVAAVLFRRLPSDSQHALASLKGTA
jgi:MFS family permease